MTRKCLLICSFFLVVGLSSSLSIAERPLVVLGNDALDLTVQSLVTHEMQVINNPILVEPHSAADASHFMATLLAARLTILEKSALHPMLVERTQHQGASLLIVEFSSSRESLPIIQDRMRVIHRALVQAYPDHANELSRLLELELRKLRSQRATKHPRTAFFADSSVLQSLIRLDGELRYIDESFLAKHAR